MEKTKAYRTILKTAIIACVGALILFLCMLYSNNIIPLTFSIGLMGTCAPYLFYKLRCCFVLILEFTLFIVIVNVQVFSCFPCCR
jgi:hypothetical protein